MGVHLDTWLGTLSYFLNREPLGLAFGELRHKNLYPVISSTAARSGMKVIATRSYPTSLQFMCAQALRRWVVIAFAGQVGCVCICWAGGLHLLGRWFAFAGHVGCVCICWAGGLCVHLLGRWVVCVFASAGEFHLCLRGR